MLRAIQIGFVLAALAATPPAQAAPSTAAARKLASRAQEILDKHCVKCHGPLERKVGLELDTLEAALRGSEDGPVIAPGQPAHSKLIAALAPDADPHMPPKKQLTDAELATLGDWVASLKPGAAQPAAAPRNTAASARSRVPEEPTAAIDHFLEAGWRERRIQPAARSDDTTFVRRIYLDLAGRIPTLAESRAFLSNRSPRRRVQLVETLLASPEYARTFRETWDVLLMGRQPGRREERRRDNGWYAFLDQAFAKNRPWNEVVRDIVLARPDSPDRRGALWFVFERRNDYQRIAEALAPVIYGTRIDCAQCHDHPLAREIRQAHYWGLVSAFNRSKNTEGGEPAVGESAIGGFVSFTNLKKESQPALLTLLDGRTIPEERPAPEVKEEDAPERYVDAQARARVPKISRRALFATAATQDNPLLARSFVNHTWAILMGRGLVHPVDEMNSKHPASHPELLDWLAADFATHNHDMKRLVRAIVLSRAYQLDRPAVSTAPPAESFAAALERPLPAETMARSARIAAGLPADDPALRLAFAEAFPDVLPRVPRATIQQSMLLANNPTLAGLFQPNPTNAVAQLLALPRPDDRIRAAFQMTLVRAPDRAELERTRRHLETQPQDPARALGDLLWALVTTPEFLNNH